VPLSTVNLIDGELIETFGILLANNKNANNHSKSKLTINKE
jgi:hypothetical protein